MLPQTRPVANFRQERLSENDMNQRLHMMEMHRSAAQEPYRAQVQGSHQQTPPIPSQPQPRQQPYLPPAPPPPAKVRMRTTLDTIKLQSGDDVFHLPPNCISAQIIQAWVPKMEYKFNPAEQQVYRTVFIKEHDNTTNANYTIPLTLPYKTYSSIEEIIDTLNTVARNAKTLRYDVLFKIVEDKVSIQISNLDKIDNNPDTFDRTYGDYRNTTDISIIWHVDSLLATILGYSKNSPLFPVVTNDSLQYDADTEPYRSNGVPFFHLYVPDYMVSDVILQPAAQKDSYHGQTFETDEGMLTFVSNLQDAQMERTEPIVCHFKLKHPMTDYITIQVPTNKVIFLRIRMKLMAPTK